MPVPNKKVQEFLQTACKQIRFKKIHSSIMRELSDHIEDQKNEYIQQGLDEETATTKAVEQMGDPVTVGQQLDKTHRPRTEWSILSLVALIVAVGGAVQYFLSGINHYTATHFSDFLVYAPIGIAVLIGIYFLDYTLLARYSKPLYFILLALIVFGSSFLVYSNGVNVTASSLFLLFIPIFAGIVYGFRNQGLVGILGSGLFYGGAAFFCFFSRPFSTFIILSLSCLLILTVALVKGLFGCNKKLGFALIYLPTLVAPLLLPFSPLLSSGHRMRLILFFQTGRDPAGGSYQHLMIKKLFASSQSMGKAVLEGNLAQMNISDFFPAWSTDFSLTYLFARLGYVAGFSIVALFLILMIRILVSVLKQKNDLGFLLSLAAWIAISAQVILYVLTNIGLIPPAAVHLPLISFGKVGFVINMILIGLVLSVYRRTDLVGSTLDPSPRWRIHYKDGKIIIDLGFGKGKYS